MGGAGGGEKKSSLFSEEFCKGAEGIHGADPGFDPITNDLHVHGEGGHNHGNTHKGGSHMLKGRRPSKIHDHSSALVHEAGTHGYL